MNKRKIKSEYATDICGQQSQKVAYSGLCAKKVVNPLTRVEKGS